MRKQRNIAQQFSLLILALVALAGAASGQTTNAWSAVGPSVGETLGVYSLAVDPGNPNIVYIGAFNGVFRSMDGGASWRNIGLHVVKSLVVDPVNPGNIYAGLAQNGNCLTRYLYKSTNGGTNWSNAFSPVDCGISSVAIDPSSPNTIYAGSVYSQYGEDDDLIAVLWKSNDGGISWARRQAPGPGLWIDPSNSQIIYTSSDPNYDSTPITTLFKSTDSGANWIPTGRINPPVTTVAIDPVDSNTLYAGTAGAVLKTIDGGTSWFAVDKSQIFGPGSIRTIVIDKGNPNVLYAASDSSGVFKSIDGGAHWRAMSEGLTNLSIRTLVLGPGKVLYAAVGTSSGLGSGVFKIVDSAAPPTTNQIEAAQFFVRQHYLDFLNREPDPPGLAGWLNVLNNCAPGDTSCDRVHVSAAFFQSPEFQERGYFVYRFYSASFGRKPDFTEFMPDLARVSGFLNGDQLEAAKVAFVNDFVSRPDFVTKYNSLSNVAYVDALINTAGVNLSNRQALIDSLNNNALTRAQVLRQIVESSEVYQKYYNQAFVVMEYFGYLRRDPDALYLNWIDVLNQSGEPRHMVSGFVTSQEYRQRFGQ